MRPAFLSTTQLPYDGLLQSLERFADVPGETDMDVLSEVLKVVKLQGAMFYNGEFPLRGAFAHRHRATSRPSWLRERSM